MTFVITSPCKGEKNGECVEVCPVDCISEGESQYYIDPDSCIECGACVSVCPVEAIFMEDELGKANVAYVEEAIEFFKNS